MPKGKELEALLCWYGVPPKELGKLEEHFERWMEICGWNTPVDDKWTFEDNELEALLRWYGVPPKELLSSQK